MWTKEDSHLTFQECHSLLLEQFTEAVDPQWAANYIVRLVKNDLLNKYDPCDTCPHTTECEECPY